MHVTQKSQLHSLIFSSENEVWKILQSDWERTSLGNKSDARIFLNIGWVCSQKVKTAGNDNLKSFLTNSNDVSKNLKSTIFIPFCESMGLNFLMDYKFLATCKMSEKSNICSQKNWKDRKMTGQTKTPIS